MRGAGPKQFVEAQTLREADYAAKEAELDGIEGLLAVDATAPLAPTRAFARALLGGVGPATGEQVEKSGGKVAPGQQIGQWGLQQVFDERLAGAPERSILIRDAETGDPVRTLRKLPGREPRALRTTLSRDAQEAAEHALADERAEAAVIAVQPSTGDILAVANRPVDSTFNRALAGAYAPGSTFKVISTAALLRDGLDPGRDRGLPADARRRRQDVQELRGRGGRRRHVRRRLRDLVQHGVRQAQLAAAGERAVEGGQGLRRSAATTTWRSGPPAPACRPARTRSAAPRR